MDAIVLFEQSKLNPQRVTVEATVTTGFESVALDECREIFKNITEICKLRGRIMFNIDAIQVNEVLNMRSVDNVFIVAHVVPDIAFNCDNIEDDIASLKNLANDVDWVKVISVWKDIITFNGICYPTKVEYLNSFELEQVLKSDTRSLLETDPLYKPRPVNMSEHTGSSPSNSVGLKDSSKDSQKCTKQNRKMSKQAEWDYAKIKSVRAEIYNKLDNRNPIEKVLKYRVTCNRSGKHTFGSQDAAYHFGGRLQDMFSWIVDLEMFDLEIVLNIKNNMVYVTLALTKESKHIRNINHFGPTTLRATVCYNLVRLGEPKVGDIIVDPLAGGGSIPIEGALGFPGTFHIAGDVHPKATVRSWSNIVDLNNNKKRYMDLLAWDAKKLPLRDSSVDLFVSDLPFGKRSGSKKDNRVLYKEVLFELGRVVRKGQGRVVLLTQDRRSIMLAISQMTGLWKQTKTLGVNIGGLCAAVYVLKRTFST